MSSSHSSLIPILTVFQTVSALLKRIWFSGGRLIFLCMYSFVRRSLLLIPAENLAPVLWIFCSCNIWLWLRQYVCTGGYISLDRINAVYNLFLFSSLKFQNLCSLLISRLHWATRFCVWMLHPVFLMVSPSILPSVHVSLSWLLMYTGGWRLVSRWTMENLMFVDIFQLCSKLFILWIRSINRLLW